MSTPMSSEELLTAFDKFNVPFHAVPGWEQHNREGHGDWGPVNGVMLHHTVTEGTKTSVNLCWNGYEGLPGPLCHGVIGKDGTCYLVGWGRTNHAGLGDPRVLEAVIAQQNPLPPKQRNIIDGNSRFYGFECENMGDGVDPWPVIQLRTMALVTAAICSHHRWNEYSVIGHKEWQVGKVDPLGISMDHMRDQIARHL